MVTWLAGPVVNLACQLAPQHYAPAARRTAVRIYWVQRHRRAASQASVTLKYWEDRMVAYNTARDLYRPPDSY